MRGCLAGAHHDGIVGILRSFRGFVGQGQNTVLGGVDFTAGGGDIDTGPIVGEGGSGTGLRRGADGDDVLTARRGDVAHVLIIVPGGGDDD